MAADLATAPGRLERTNKSKTGLGRAFAYEGDKLRSLNDGATPTPPLVRLIDSSFRALVLSEDFPCLAARAAVKRQDYRLGLYGQLGAAGNAPLLLVDLQSFIDQCLCDRERFSTFVAVFTGPVAQSERVFERYLWRQLQALHDLDVARSPWDPKVSDDPQNPHFSFSLGGEAFFIVSLHPAASRWARRFAWPTLIFNAHAQFEMLRQRNAFESMQKAIRRRDVMLQGSVNPALATYGDLSEARQYAGRLSEEDWICPFRKRSPQ